MMDRVEKLMVELSEIYYFNMDILWQKHKSRRRWENGHQITSYKSTSTEILFYRVDQGHLYNVLTILNIRKL